MGWFLEFYFSNLTTLSFLLVSFIVFSTAKPSLAAGPFSADNPAVQLTNKCSELSCLAHFGYLGSAQIFTVPNGVTSVGIVVPAAPVGNALINTSTYSPAVAVLGGSVSGTLAVTGCCTLSKTYPGVRNLRRASS